MKIKNNLQYNKKDIEKDNGHQVHSYNYSLSLIEAIRDPLFAINLEYHITEVNNASVTKTDTPYIKLIGTSFSIYFTDHLKANICCDTIFSDGFISNYPLVIKDGHLTEVLVSGSIYKDNKGKVIGAVMVARDITDQKRKEKELIESKVFAELATVIAEEAKLKAEAAAQLAETAVKSKQQFLSNMSHEIRTPMNAIIGFTKVLLKTDLSENQIEYLTAIKLSGDALIVLINDILDLAKAEAGKMVFEQLPFKMYNSVNTMMHLFERKTQERNIILVEKYDKNIPEILIGDSVRLHQILINLLSNAAKFTTNGNIIFSTKLIKEDNDKVNIEFSIADSGIGIAEEYIDKIFENFQQASNNTTRLFGGTGLGLAIVKQLVEAQGGSISVKSKLGEGSVFTFILEFKKTKLEPVHISNFMILDKEVHNIKVLAVEDIVLNQLLMKTLLDDFGFERDIAANGKIAIEKLLEKKYDIILMDLQMPIMNGFEATSYIRNTMHSNIPIIALTADVTTVDLAKCMSLGMNDYISKPIDEKLLYSKIVTLVKKYTVQQASQIKASSIHVIERYTDLEYLSQRTKSNPQMMIEMISLYLDQTPSLISLMKESLQNEDWTSLNAAVHKLIPSFAIMGISANVTNMAIEIMNKSISQQHNERLPMLLEELENICNKSCIELAKELNTLKLSVE